MAGWIIKQDPINDASKKATLKTNRLKESIYHDKRINLNVYAPNNRASQHIKQKLIKLQEEIGKLAVTAILQYLSLNNWQNKYTKISKGIGNLNISQLTWTSYL